MGISRYETTVPGESRPDTVAFTARLFVVLLRHGCLLRSLPKRLADETSANPSFLTRLAYRQRKFTPPSRSMIIYPRSDHSSLEDRTLTAHIESLSAVALGRLSCVPCKRAVYFKISYWISV